MHYGVFIHSCLYLIYTYIPIQSSEWINLLTFCSYIRILNLDIYIIRLKLRFLQLMLSLCNMLLSTSVQRSVNTSPFRLCGFMTYVATHKQQTCLHLHVFHYNWYSFNVVIRHLCSIDIPFVIPRMITNSEAIHTRLNSINFS